MLKHTQEDEMKIGLAESTALVADNDIIKSASSFHVDGIEPFVIETATGYLSWSEKGCVDFRKQVEN